ncbi:hypothetical protein K2X14_10220 [Acetobacter sp. TBRC 12305]|uniref:Uncharacterized protein n=1 Tax=Acetobacter garciniae TaxID=2817435 RepID=A0A939KN68_9PROT|nr:hypothetical protein [Acetobacter garciniae]MBO1326048.1 hypothetical protein [Acetobacter garciniae]MBX0345208.1 hypothetical protein [Acetobacter garciniae]
MAIREVTVTVGQDGADYGKRFVITRMPAIQADRWGRHCLQAAIAGGGDIPGLAEGAGLAGVAAVGLGIFGAMEPARMDALIDELMRCISVQPDPANPALRRALHDSDIEEIPTVGWLQKEAFALHVDFFKGVSQLFSLLSGLLAQPDSDLPPDTPL